MSIKNEIIRMSDNIRRFDEFINEQGEYTTCENQRVENLPSFMSRISEELSVKISKLEETASKSAEKAQISAKLSEACSTEASEASIKAVEAENMAKIYAARIESGMLAIVDAYLSRLFPNASFLDIFNSEGLDLNNPSLTNSPFMNERIVNGAYSLSIGDGQAIDLMGGEND